MTDEQRQLLKRAQDAMGGIETKGHPELVPIATSLDAIVKLLGAVLSEAPASTKSQAQGATVVRRPKTEIEEKTSKTF